VSENKTIQSKEDPFDKRILVFDDDDAIRHMIQATLEAEGFQVKTGRDGRNVLQTAQQFRPNLVISDMMMPNGGGFELLRALQTDPDIRHVPVLLISGHAFDESTRAMCKQESNVIGFFVKPLRPAQFIAKIHELLNTRSKDEKMLDERKKIDEISRNRFEDMF
jgi:CheY-like chemotaxis protein